MLLKINTNTLKNKIMKKEIKKEIIKHLDNIYYLIIQNNKESKEVKKILSLVDELQNKTEDLNTKKIKL